MINSRFASLEHKKSKNGKPTYYKKYKFVINPENQQMIYGYLKDHDLKKNHKQNYLYQDKLDNFFQKLKSASENNKYNLTSFLKSDLRKINKFNHTDKIKFNDQYLKKKLHSYYKKSDSKKKYNPKKLFSRKKIHFNNPNRPKKSKRIFKKLSNNLKKTQRFNNFKIKQEAQFKKQEAQLKKQEILLKKQQQKLKKQQQKLKKLKKTKRKPKKIFIKKPGKTSRKNKLKQKNISDFFGTSDNPKETITDDDTPEETPDSFFDDDKKTLNNEDTNNKREDANSEYANSDDDVNSDDDDVNSDDDDVNSDDDEANSDDDEANSDDDEDDDGEDDDEEDDDDEDDEDDEDDDNDEDDEDEDKTKRKR